MGGYADDGEYIESAEWMGEDTILIEVSGRDRYGGLLGVKLTMTGAATGS